MLSLAALLTTLALISPSWLGHWLRAGAGLETLLLLLGQLNDARVLPAVPLYAAISTLNLAYAICSTSWLLYILFAAACWHSILLTSLYQFESAARLARRGLRTLLVELQFARDQIAMFNIPALEIDTEVSGLLVIRGLTISLSSLTIVAHGIELGIRMNAEMELALYADEVTIALFRSISISDCYASLKGGQSEMTFGKLEERSAARKSAFDSDTPLLQASSGKDGKLQPPRMTASRGSTGGKVLEDSSVSAGIESLERLDFDDDQASKAIKETLQHLSWSGAISQCHREFKEQPCTDKDSGPLDLEEEEIRAAICSRLHGRPSAPHPPTRSIRVTTLQNLTPAWLRRFLHRLPWLLRMLLAPLSYLHSMSISSITAAVSGLWLRDIIHAQVFKDYAEDNAELHRLAKRLEGWLDSAFFVVEMVAVDASAQVPVDPAYDIKTSLRFNDVLAYRANLETSAPVQIIRLDGGNAAVTIPSCLLPHHEHLVPALKSEEEIARLSDAVVQARGKPKTVRAEKRLERAENDECCIAFSGHASLPLCLDQELINFVMAFVKAAKVIELEKTADETSATDDEESELPSPPSSPVSADSKFARVVRKVQQSTKDGVKATQAGIKIGLVGATINGTWSLVNLRPSFCCEEWSAQADLSVYRSLDCKDHRQNCEAFRRCTG